MSAPVLTTDLRAQLTSEGEYDDAVPMAPTVNRALRLRPDENAKIETERQNK